MNARTPSARGRLALFLDIAPGVGKTAAMLLSTLAGLARTSLAAEDDCPAAPRAMPVMLAAGHVAQPPVGRAQPTSINGTDAGRERIMVAIGPSQSGEHLVHWTRRLATSLGAPWLAVHIEGLDRLTPDQQAQLNYNLDLARNHGAEVIVLTGETLVESLLGVARQRQATQIVVGKPLRPEWREWLRGGSVHGRLARMSGGIDVTVVSSAAAVPERRRGFWRPRRQSGWRQYLEVFGVVAAATLANLALQPFISYEAVALLMLLVVIVLPLYYGRGPVLLAAALSALSWNFLFIPPTFTIFISKLEDVLLFVLYFVIALVAGSLTTRLRAQGLLLQEREERTRALYGMVREFAQLEDVDAVVQSAVEHLKRAFAADIAVILAAAPDRLAEDVHAASTFRPDASGRAIAERVFDPQRADGPGALSAVGANGLYRSLRAPGSCVGVVGLQVHGPDPMTLEQEAFLEAMLGQVALAIEHEQLRAAQERAARLTESERLHKTLLNSVSHELRTPIAAITGAASLLRALPETQADARSDLSREIQLAGERLNRLVENLLDMSRLESGMLRLRLEWCDVTDLVAVTVQRVRPLLERHEFLVEVAAGLSLVQLDFVLIEQVLVNLLHNAAVYTPEGTRVRLEAYQDGEHLALVVSDRGPGLPEDSFERVFDKFYRLPGVAAGGTGLGLSIARGIVEAHGGTLTAGNRAQGGARFVLRLPLSAPPDVPAEVADATTTRASTGLYGEKRND